MTTEENGDWRSYRNENISDFIVHHCAAQFLRVQSDSACLQAVAAVSAAAWLMDGSAD